MATFSAVHVDPPVTSEHAWGLAFLRHRMQRGRQMRSLVSGGVRLRRDVGLWRSGGAVHGWQRAHLALSAMSKSWTEEVCLGRLRFRSLDRGGLCPPFPPSLAPSDPAASWVVLFGKIVKG